MGATEGLVMMSSVFISLCGIGLLVYLVYLFFRLVRAVEKIAEKK